MIVENPPGSLDENLPIIDFVSPIPGFPNDRRFMLVQIDDIGLLYALTSLDTPGLRFLVAPPAPFFPEYAPEIDDETIDSLGARAQDLLIFLVVSPGDSAEGATVNLMAPIVVDMCTRRACQLILAGSGLAIRQPLLCASS